MTERTILNPDTPNPKGRLRAPAQWSAAWPGQNMALRGAVGVMIICAVTALIFAPKALLYSGAYLLSAFVIFIAGLRLCAILYTLIAPRRALDAPPSFDWPLYTVLVPIIHEAHMVERLMKALARLDYPRDRLEIVMICEQADPHTIAAVQANLRAPFRLVIAEDSQPRTKPKAMNVALPSCSGEVITIYDAEDRPHPDQLKRAALALHYNPDLGAVQASLRYFNARQNVLTRQFSFEYAALFEVWNPFLARLGLPFPLGGTSNHMRRSALDAVGGWDPHNVTEDADLSFRLAAYGYSIGTIVSHTDEEAVSELINWRKQRTRWQKGFLQSWQVHMRMLRAASGADNARRFFTLQITTGATLLAGLLHLPAVTTLIAWLLYNALSGTPPALSPAFYIVIILGYGSAIAQGLMGYFRAGYKGFLGHAAFMPLYWLFMFIPTLFAISDLINRPFHWHKTRHGDDQNTSKTQ